VLARERIVERPREVEQHRHLPAHRIPHAARGAREHRVDACELAQLEPAAARRTDEALQERRVGRGRHGGEA
jgi:hypothetical protein